MTQAITLKKQIEEQHNFPIQLLSDGRESYLFWIAVDQLTMAAMYFWNNSL